VARELTDDQLRWLYHELVLQALDEIFITPHDSQTRRLMMGAYSWCPDADKATIEKMAGKLRKGIEGLAQAIHDRRDKMIEQGKATRIEAGG
jgi:hypothetical protein